MRRSIWRSLEQTLQRKTLLYDKGGEEHYNLISALHKSMRNSDPDAAVYWLARMIEAGEDPLYVARRLVRFASEDVGNADPQALVVAVAARRPRTSSACPRPTRRSPRPPSTSRPRRRATPSTPPTAPPPRPPSGRGRTGAAAPAQRADEADEAARLRQGLPVRPRRAGRRRRDGLPAGHLQGRSSTARPNADSKRRSNAGSTAGRN